MLKENDLIDWTVFCLHTDRNFAVGIRNRSNVTDVDVGIEDASLDNLHDVADFVVVIGGFWRGLWLNALGAGRDDGEVGAVSPAPEIAVAFLRIANG